MGSACFAEPPRRGAVSENVNVAAALSCRHRSRPTTIEIWPTPHRAQIATPSRWTAIARFSLSIENIPSENPKRTITALSQSQLCASFTPRCGWE
jgi:hypothetical protein